MTERQVVERCWQEMDATWLRLLEEDATRRDPLGVACRVGCAACCTYLPSVLSAEAAVIAEHVEAAESEVRGRWLTRLYSWKLTFEDWITHDPMPNPSESNEDHQRWRVRWQRHRYACPFLDMDTYACSIYDSRPSTCRSHHAVAMPDTDNPPPEGCFTTPQWRLDVRLPERFGNYLTASLELAGYEWSASLLGLAVVREGERRYGWRRPRGGLPLVESLSHARLMVTDGR